MKNQKSPKLKFSKAGQSRMSSREFQSRFEFGGELMKRAKNRGSRPISTRETMHVVLKSSKAVGNLSFGYKSNPILIKNLIDTRCAKYGVKLISYANSFNHLHLHLKFPSRAIYLKFIRSLTAAIAMTITGAAKRRGLQTLIGAKKFFDYRPFTRIVRGMKAFKIAQNYVRLNELESAGVMPKRKGRLREVRPNERMYFEID